MKIVIERGNLMKKFLNIFLVFAMIFSMIFQYSGTASAQELPNNVITGANITDLSNKPITTKIGGWRPFRVHVDYTLPSHGVHQGDTTTLLLPAAFQTAKPDDFEVKAGNDIIAKGKMIAAKDGNPAKVKLAYTNYVESHSGTSGSFFFNIQINSDIQPTFGLIPVTLTVQGDDNKVINAGSVDFFANEVKPVNLLKSGWMVKEKMGGYKININQENKAMLDAVLVDKLLSPGVSYRYRGSGQFKFTILEGKWVRNPTKTDVKLTEERDITDEFINANKISLQGDSFTINIGNRPAGKGLQIRYFTDISHKPVVGEEFINEAQLSDDGKTLKHKISYKIIGAGGSGQGYVYKINIKSR